MALRFIRGSTGNMTRECYHLLLKLTGSKRILCVAFSEVFMEGAVVDGSQAYRSTTRAYRVTAASDSPGKTCLSDNYARVHEVYTDDIRSTSVYRS